MIYFTTLRWKNLLSTGNEFTEISLNEHKTTLIVGENGSGKSTILDALTFGLFGRPFRRVNKPQLVNSITQKNCVVEVYFSIGTNNYKIIRGIKPSIFEVYQNDKLLNQSAEVKDYQEILEKQILKVSHKSFCQVVVLGSATFQPFMQLPAGQRREIIEDLLDLQIFTTMNLLLKNKVQTNSEKLFEIQSTKRFLEEKIKLVKEHLKELRSNNDQLAEEKKKIIIDTNSQIEKLDDEYWKIENLRKDLEEQIKDEDSVSKKINKLSKLKHQIEAKLSILKKDISFLEEYDDCPTCKQSIDKQFKCDTIEHKNKEVKEIDDGLKDLSIQYEKANDDLNKIMEIQSEINDTKMEIHRVKTKISSLIDYRDNIENEIKSINKNKKSIDDNKVVELESDLNYSIIKYNELMDDKSILHAAGTLLKDGGIKSKIVKQYIPVINKLINKYLSSMEFMCHFELDEEFNETIKSRYRDNFSYSSFSEGEKMRINLAILFTWRAIAKMRNSINTNILIMDEVFDSSLDSNGTDEFIKILYGLTSDTNTVIISHKVDQLYEKFEKVIRVEKKKNFSKVKS